MEKQCAVRMAVSTASRSWRLLLVLLNLLGLTLTDRLGRLFWVTPLLVVLARLTKHINTHGLLPWQTLLFSW